MPEISPRYLFIRKTDAISLYPRKRPARRLFIREAYAAALYVFEERMRDAQLLPKDEVERSKNGYALYKLIRRFGAT